MPASRLAAGREARPTRALVVERQQAPGQMDLAAAALQIQDQAAVGLAGTLAGQRVGTLQRLEVPELQTGRAQTALQAIAAGDFAQVGVRSELDGSRAEGAFSVCVQKQVQTQPGGFQVAVEIEFSAAVIDSSEVARYAPGGRGTGQVKLDLSGCLHVLLRQLDIRESN